MHYLPALIALGLVALLLLVAMFRKPSKIETTRDGALLALSQVLDWSKWMSSIQTAAIGGLMLLVFKNPSGNQNPVEMSFVAYVFVCSGFACLGAALYCSAWVLGSTPSLGIRIYSNKKEGLDVSYDIYEMPLFAWTNLPLGYVLSVNHWLWGAGLASIGIFVGTRLFS